MREKLIIRMDITRMAIKYKSWDEPRSHGWKNLENGFKSRQEMQSRFDKLLADKNHYEEG